MIALLVATVVGYGLPAYAAPAPIAVSMVEVGGGGGMVPNAVGTPTNVTATAGNSSAAISFDYSGDPVSNFEYQVNGSGTWVPFVPAITSSPAVVTGLTNGTPYTFQLRAVPVDGGSAGPASASSNSITPTTVPGIPTINSVIPGSGQATLDFATPIYDGGSAITDYEYSTDDGVTWNSGGMSSPITVAGLENGTQYLMKLRAVNSTGAGPSTAATAVTPRTVPGVPTGLAATSGIRSSVLTWTAPESNGGAAISMYQISINDGQWLDGTAATTYTATGLLDGAPYVYKVRAVNAAGPGPASAEAGATTKQLPGSPTINSVTPEDRALLIGFTPGSTDGVPINNYEVSLDGGSTFSVTTAGTLASPFRIEGLVNGTSYNVVMRAVNDVGTSSNSNAISATPVAVPGAPTNLVTNAGNMSAALSWTAPNNGGSAITNYEYQLNGGNWVPFAPAVTGTQAVLTGLTNGETYSVKIRAINAIGTGPESSAANVTPAFIPTAPSALAVNPADSQLIVSFTPPSDTGGLPITNYEYTLDGGTTWTNANTTTSPVTISGLVNGQNYTVALRAVNNVGPGAASAPVGPVAPQAVPLAPVLTGLTAGDSSLTVTFTQPSNGVIPVADYEYTLNGGVTWQSTGTSVSPWTLTGLANGTTYTIALRAVNNVGPSLMSNTGTATPAGLPFAPTDLVATPGDSSASIAFTAESDNGRAITNYAYSVDGGPLNPLNPAASVSPVTIPGLTNGVTYVIELAAINSVGVGPTSAGVTVTPQAVPSAPSITSVTTAGLVDAADVNFTQPSDGGFPVLQYEYTLDNGATWSQFEQAGSTSPKRITGLTAGTTYDVQIRALNAVGAGEASNSESFTTSNVPSAPTMDVVATGAGIGSGNIGIEFTPGAANGVAISNYEFSIDGGLSWTAFVPPITSSPALITGLEDYVAYEVAIRAVNGVGSGESSAFVQAIPSDGTPSQPTALEATALNGAAEISFEQFTDGGSPITNYQVLVCDIAGPCTGWVALDPAQTTSPIEVGGLINGTTYNIFLRAVNANGISAGSLGVEVTPESVPSVPTGLVANPGDGLISLSWNAVDDGGSAIINFEYELDDSGEWLPFDPAIVSSPGSITGLTNYETYSVKLRAVNALGAGPASDPVVATPVNGKPAAPTALVATYGNASASIAFTPGFDGGAAITNYEYTTNGGVSWTAFDPAATASPVVVSGLTNGTEYNIALRALNANGAGAASTAVAVTPSTTPAAPTALVATPGNASASIVFTPGFNGGSAITNYEYTLNGGSTWTAFDPAATASPVVVSGLTNGTEYNIALRALNANGAGAASTAVAVTPSTTAAAPSALVATAAPNSASIAFTAGNNGGAAITNYEYTTNGGSTWTAFDPAATASPVVVSGLTNGTEYNIALRAVNLNGAGAASEPVSVMPVDVPGAPTGITSVSGFGAVMVTFTPGATNGSATTAYEYTIDGGTTWVNTGSLETTFAIQGLTNGVGVNLQVRAVNAVGNGVPSAVVPVEAQGAGFVPVDPVRAYDSRQTGGPLSTGQFRSVPIDAPAGAVAVAYNVTVTETVGNGFLSIVPGGQDAAPTTSTINWVPGQTVANGFVVGLDGTGEIQAYVGGGGSTQFIVDVVGYYVPNVLEETASSFVSQTPVRTYDSRDTQGALASGAMRQVNVTAGGIVPSNATAVAYTLTATGTSGAGYLAVAPSGDAAPAVSTLNWDASNSTLANTTVVGINNGAVDVYAGGGGSAQFIIDIVGYYVDDESGTYFTPIDPARSYDSRDQQGPLTPGAGRTTSVQVAGVPANVGGVAFNLTVISNSPAGFLTVTPGGTATPPLASTINWMSNGQVAANGSVVGSNSNSVTTFAGVGGANYITDIAGFFN